MAERATVTCPKCGHKTIVVIEPCDMPTLIDKGRQEISRDCSECGQEFEATVCAYWQYEIEVAAYCSDPDNCVDHRPVVYGTHG